MKVDKSLDLFSTLDYSKNIDEVRMKAIQEPRAIPFRRDFAF